MNKVFKVIWNEARNAYVVVSEIAKNHGSKSCSTKKLLAMLIATGVMTCASFDVLAAEPSGTDTAKSQYVAFADPTHTLYNEILMTVKDDNGHFYSYWASAVTDPSATMSTYRLAEYKKDLSVLVENDEKLSRNDIKEVTLDTTQANSATIGLLRNGDTEAGAPVKGAITVTSGGGTDGSGAANDTFVKISNGTANQTFATGSKVEVNGPANAITGIKVNGVDYTIKQGSGVKVEQDATKKTTTITVDGNATTITDTDTTYTAGDGIEINGGNAISVSKNLIGMESIQGAGEGKIINEFAPEMGRIRVDRISGEDGDRDKIERVRVNAVKGERDHYGNKIAKAEAKAK